MPDYQKMYAILCGAISDALDLLPLTPENMPSVALLQKALTDAEDLYLES